MRFSVVIPTCDRPERLARAIASVRSQTFQAAEIVVVNDGESVVRDGAVRIIASGPRAGGAAARNTGARAADHEWLAFLDDDDTWDPTYLERVASAAVEADVVLTAFLKVRERDGRLEVEPEKVPPTALVEQDFFVANPGLRGSNLVIRRGVLLEAGGFDEGLPAFHDMDLGVRLARRSPRYARVIEPLVRFHVHADPRLSTAGGVANVKGMQGFLDRHAERMGEGRVQAFRERAVRLFGVDPWAAP